MPLFLDPRHRHWLSQQNPQQLPWSVQFHHLSLVCYAPKIFWCDYSSWLPHYRGDFSTACCIANWDYASY